MLLGIDAGASLTKLAHRSADGELGFHLLATDDPERVADEIAALRPERVGLTGGGAAGLAARLGVSGPPTNEFDAWAVGARALLERAGQSVPERFLLVSVGTGTSALLVEAGTTVRVGGTALGGGTLAGLAQALVGTANFDAVTRLAQAGDRRRVDLLVADIYPQGESPLAGEINAASFAKLARGPQEPRAEASDLAHALMGLLGENIGLICCGLAAIAGVDRIVYGGSTLRNNPAIADILRVLAAVHGHEATILPDGAFTGAVGAMELAAGTCGTREAVS
jgi:type II pantothenate kinase